MLSFALRRLVFILLVAVLTVYFSFLGMALIGPAQPLAGESRFLPAASQALEDTGTFFLNLIQGDLGTVATVSGETAVAGLAGFAFKNSLGLLGISLLAATLLGFLSGALAAFSRKKRTEYSLLFATLAGISIPSFALAVILQQSGILYTVRFGRRLVSMGGYAWDFQHMALPLIVLSVYPLAYISRATYISLTQVMEEDYIRTALAKGLTLTYTALVHALRNVGVSLLTAVGVSLRFSLSVLPIVEFIFAWPGLGLRFLEGINNRIPLQVAVLALLIGLLIQATTFLLDFSFRFIDPRLRSVA